MDVVLVDREGNPLAYTAGSPNGALGVYKRLPPMADLVMAGKVWQVQDQTTTIILDLPPTTTSGLSVQNPAGSGVYIVVVALMGIVDVTPGTLTSWALWHCPQKLAGAVLTRDITLQSTGVAAISGLKAGQGAYQGTIILDRAASCVDDGWAPISKLASNVVGALQDISIYTKLPVPVIIPPSYSYALHCVGGSTTTELGHGLVWAEVTLDELQ